MHHATGSCRSAAVTRTRHYRTALMETPHFCQSPISVNAFFLRVKLHIFVWTRQQEVNFCCAAGRYLWSIHTRMRVLLRPGGIAACFFVWIFWLLAKITTNSLFFNVIFSETLTSDGLGTSSGFDGAQLGLTYYGSVLRIIFECVTWLGLISHVGTVFTDPGSTKKSSVHPSGRFHGGKEILREVQRPLETSSCSSLFSLQ